MNNPSDLQHPVVCKHDAITVIGLSAFVDNLIWLIQMEGIKLDEFSPVCVVDPGDAMPVINYCERNQLIPVTILLTHHHADHTGGVAEIESWMHMTHPGCSVAIYGPQAEAIPVVNHSLAGGEKIQLLPSLNANVFDVAGHTRGHLAYYISQDARCCPPALFSGDLIFGLGCGRLFEGSAAQMYSALTRLAKMDPSTQIYCAHEYTELNLPFALKVDPDNTALLERAGRIRVLRRAGESTLPLSLQEECLTNPFLRTDQLALVKAVCAAAQNNPCDVFTELRKLRDTFKIS